MEQAGGGFWRKQHNMNYLVSKNMKYSYNSWEERAFAEDAGGCIMWPPRSYTCGFCRREFRSAQALGGHMNVHRRDRAMLSQSLLSNPNPSNNSANIASPTPTPTPPPPPPSSWSRLLGMQDSGSHDIETGLSVGSKRQRLGVSSSPISSSPCFQVGEKVGFKASLSSMEDLDLELRLGHDPPQVK